MAFIVNNTKLLYLVLFTILGCSINSRAQGLFVKKADGTLMVESKYAEVEGSPYWNDLFAEGETKYKQNGKWHQYRKARYDTFKDEFEYEQPSVLKLLRFDASHITEFKLNGSVFRCNFPSIGEWNNLHFYQVLYDGNVKLLKKIYTKIITPTDFGSVTKPSKFVREEKLYIIKNEKIHHIKRKKSAVLEILSDKESIIKEFVKSNRLDYSNESDLIKIFELYDQETPIR